MSNPVAATPLLEETFRRIQRDRMQGLPLLNPALRVEAVGFAAWGEDWLGVLITPWFINLVMLPGESSQWQQLTPTSATVETFAAGEFEFLVARDALLGTYKTCPLFSPALEFTDQDAARHAAVRALAALHARPEPVTPPAPGRLDRRAFLCGEFGRRAK